MKYIFLDTNIFYNNWHLKNANFKYLFNYLENTGYKLIISELVSEEVQNIHKREFELSYNELRQAIHKIEKLIDETNMIDIDALPNVIYNFKELLEEKARSVEFISYEHINQREVVRRALQKIRPFQEEDKGYRDTLIWLSLLSFLSKKQIKGQVIFVTNNKSDFYNKENNNFHSDLKKDIENLNLECTFKTYTSLFNFIEDNIDKKQHEFTSSELLDEYFNNMDVEFEVESISYINNIPVNHFKEILANNQLRDFPYLEYLSSHSIELMEGVEDPEILFYKGLTKEKVYVSFRFNLRICILRFTIDTAEYFKNRENIDKLYYEVLTSEYETSFCTYVRTFIDASFEFDTTTRLIDGFEIETIDFK